MNFRCFSYRKFLLMFYEGYIVSIKIFAKCFRGHFKSVCSVYNVRNKKKLAAMIEYMKKTPTLNALERFAHTFLLLAVYFIAWTSKNTDCTLCLHRNKIDGKDIHFCCNCIRRTQFYAQPNFYSYVRTTILKLYKHKWKYFYNFFVWVWSVFFFFFFF